MVKEISARMKERLSFGPLSVGFSQEVRGKRDVVFIVENQRFPVHAEILCKLSPVFKVMFAGPFKKEKEIFIEDIRASAFSLFLRLIYEGTRSVSLIITPEDSLSCLLIANKYEMPELEHFLRIKLLRGISSANVLYILPFCELNLDIWSIRSKCWSVIEQDTANVLKSDLFPKISWDLLCDILENGHLTINEFQLFLAARRWAAYRMKTEGRSKTLVEVLGVAIYKIRFPLMTVGEFQIAKSSGLLQPFEIKDLEKNFRKNSTFCHEPRRNVCLCRKKGLRCRICVSSTATSIKGIVSCSRTPRPRTPARVVVNRGHLMYTPVQNINVRRRRPPSPGAVDASPTYPNKPSKIPKLAPEPSPPMPECECFKYKSCPGFPNGATVAILRNEGFKLV